MSYGINRRLFRRIFFVVLVAVFTMAFWKNSFKSAEENWFVSHQFDSEALVIGRLGETQLNGLSSYEGRLGTFQLTSQRKGLYTNEDFVYEHEVEDGVYRAYNSQIGFQGVLFSWIDQALRATTSLEAMQRKNALHFVASFLTALTIAALLYFISIELGLFVGIGIALITLYSQWLIVFGKNLYWVMFFMYLPMLITLYYYRHFTPNKRNIAGMLSLFAIAIAIKCACGFEYLTTIVIASFCSVVYFAIKEYWTFFRLIKHLFLVGLASVAGFIMTFIAHVYQQAVGDNISFSDALVIRFVHASQRLHSKVNDASNDVWVKAGDASTWEVVAKYWNGEAFDFGFLMNDPSMLPVNFSVFIILFAILTPLIIVGREYLPSLANNRRNTAALLATSWLAFLGTLSWYVFAKVHSYFHGHMNHVLWHIPFTIFAAAYILLVVQYVFKDYLKSFFIRLGLKGSVLGLSAALVIFCALKIISASRFDSKIDLFTQSGIHLAFSDGGLVDGYVAGNEVALFVPDCDAEQRYNARLKTEIVGSDDKFSNILLNPIKTPMFSSYKNACMGKLEFRSETPVSFTLILNGELIGEPVILGAEDAALTSFPLTDGNWSKGISRGFSGFFVENSIVNRRLLQSGRSLEFAYSGVREISRVSASESYINVTVSGAKLDAKGDGYPNLIHIKNNQD